MPPWRQGRPVTFGHLSTVYPLLLALVLSTACSASDTERSAAKFANLHTHRARLRTEIVVLENAPSDWVRAGRITTGPHVEGRLRIVELARFGSVTPGARRPSIHLVYAAAFVRATRDYPSATDSLDLSAWLDEQSSRALFGDETNGLRRWSGPLPGHGNTAPGVRTALFERVEQAYAAELQSPVMLRDMLARVAERTAEWAAHADALRLDEEATSAALIRERVLKELGEVALMLLGTQPFEDIPQD